MTITVPDWVTYPDDDWEEITPEEAGLDPDGFRQWIAGLDVRGASFGGEDHSGSKYGADAYTWGIPRPLVGRPALRPSHGVGREGPDMGRAGIRRDGRADRPRRADQQVLDGTRRAVPFAQVPDRGISQDPDVATPRRQAHGEPTLGRVPHGDREPLGGEAHGTGGARRRARELRNGRTGRATPTTTATHT